MTAGCSDVSGSDIVVPPETLSIPTDDIDEESAGVLSGRSARPRWGRSHRHPACPAPDPRFPGGRADGNGTFTTSSTSTNRRTSTRPHCRWLLRSLGRSDSLQSFGMFDEDGELIAEGFRNNTTRPTSTRCNSERGRMAYGHTGIIGFVHPEGEYTTHSLVPTAAPFAGSRVS